MDKDLPAVPLETIIQIARIAVSFLSGALTLYGIIRAKQTDLFRKLTIRHLRHDLQAARDEGDREQVKRLELHIQIQKMYLSDPTNQGTAISQIAARGDEEAFEILAQRLGDPPPLCAESQPIMRSAIKRLALGLNSHRPSEPAYPSGSHTQKARFCLKTVESSKQRPDLTCQAHSRLRRSS